MKNSVGNVRLKGNAGEFCAEMWKIAKNVRLTRSLFVSARSTRAQHTRVYSRNTLPARSIYIHTGARLFQGGKCIIHDRGTL